MLLSTNQLLEDERIAALAVAPWHERVRHLNGRVSSALKNKAIDMIDAAIGPNHARAALVATYEGNDSLMQATLDLAEPVARELAFQRLTPADPFGKGELLTPPEDPTRLALRFSKFAVEDAAVRTIAGIDHLVNAYLRFAWEANAARADEVIACGFDPKELEPSSWSSLKDVRQGLERIRSRSLPLLPSFELTDAIADLVDTGSVRETREYRNAVVHRARPLYRETPPYGRETLWTQGRFSITFRDEENDAPEVSDDVPTIADRREMVGSAILEGASLAEAMWEFALRWLATVGVFVRHDPQRDETYVTTQFQPGTQTQRFPRDQRNPGPFLRS